MEQKQYMFVNKMFSLKIPEAFTLIDIYSKKAEVIIAKTFYSRHVFLLLIFTAVSPPAKLTSPLLIVYPQHHMERKIYQYCCAGGRIFSSVAVGWVT